MACPKLLLVLQKEQETYAFATPLMTLPPSICMVPLKPPPPQPPQNPPRPLLFLCVAPCVVCSLTCCLWIRERILGFRLANLRGVMPPKSLRLGLAPLSSNNSTHLSCMTSSFTHSACEDMQGKCTFLAGQHQQHMHVPSMPEFGCSMDLIQLVAASKCKVVSKCKGQSERMSFLLMQLKCLLDCALQRKQRCVSS